MKDTKDIQKGQIGAEKTMGPNSESESNIM